MESTRRRVLSIGGLAVSGGLAGCTTDDDTGTDDWAWDGTVPVDRVTQYHQPSCGCCREYVEYLEGNGLTVVIEEINDFDRFTRTKADLGVPAEVRSCHTVEVGEYLVEGHVPLGAIESLFEATPSVRGIAIPGMPQHAPGMGPPGDEPLPVYSFDRTGETATFLEDAR